MSSTPHPIARFGARRLHFPTSLAGLVSLAEALCVLATEPMPDFQLVDQNSSSPRYVSEVSPRDYLLQVSAYYFATAGCSYCRQQFVHLRTVLEELRAANPALNVEIVGVNRADQAAYNGMISYSVNLPWLQDTEEQAVWSTWAVSMRDVWILDSLNRPVSVFNVSEHNLAFSENRANLKQMLLEAARLIDTDDDQLPDDWETHYFSDLQEAAKGDADEDGFDNFTEYAFGALPHDAASRPVFACTKGTEQNQEVLQVTFRRRAGAALDYEVEASAGLAPWQGEPSLVVDMSARRTRFDGSGTAEVTCSLKYSAQPGKRAFLRVRAEESETP
jgi:peroxiredoxin